MRPAPLPGGAGERGAHGVDQADVGVGDHQRRAGQPSSHQAPQERQPPGTILGGDHVEAEHLPMSLGIDPHGDHDGHIDDAAVLAHLLGQGVEAHVGVGTAVEGSGPERRHLGVELFGHAGHLGLGQRLDAERVHQTLDAPGRHTPHVALGYHRHQGPLGAPARLEQPARVVAALAQSGHGQVDRPHPSVQGAGPVAVAAVRALRGDLAEARVAQHLHLGGHQPLGETADHVPQQIIAFDLEVLAQPLERVHVGRDHRVVFLSDRLVGLP